MVWNLNKDSFYVNHVVPYPPSQVRDSGGNLWGKNPLVSPIHYRSTEADFNYDQGLDLSMPDKDLFLSPQNTDYLCDVVASKGWPRPNYGDMHGYQNRVFLQHIRYDQYLQFKPQYTSVQDKVREMNEKTLKEYLKEMNAEKDLYGLYMNLQFSGYTDLVPRMGEMTNPGRKSRREGLFKLPMDDQNDTALRDRYIGKQGNLDWLAVDPTYVNNRINF